MQEFLANLGPAIAVAVLEIIVMTVIFGRLLARRDRARWMPFRRHLMQVLHDEVQDSTRAATSLAGEMLPLAERAGESPPEIKECRRVRERCDSARAEFERARARAHQAIQTAAPGISSEVAPYFADIFRALDGAPSRTVRAIAELDRYTAKGASPSTRDARELKEGLAAESWSIGISVKALTESVGALLETEKFLVIDGTVATREDLERMKRVEARLQASR